MILYDWTILFYKNNIKFELFTHQSEYYEIPAVSIAVCVRIHHLQSIFNGYGFCCYGLCVKYNGKWIKYPLPIFII
jgi:hypothetical protein